jgi:hemoglobin/transferrin/lactoferrin receptor protein
MQFLNIVRVSLIILFTLFLCSNAIAQSIYFTDNNTGKPLQYVKVTCSKDSSVFYSGEDGIVLIPRHWKKQTIHVSSFNYMSFDITPDRWTKNRLEEQLQTRNDNIIRTFHYTSTRLQADVNSLPFDIYQLQKPSVLNPSNMADALERTGEVFVQRSQLGGGSPVVRGFESNRLLLVVDGIRMNTAIFRAGHLQNLLRIDPNSVGMVEVVSGSGSSIYGSDALGGVISINTQAASKVTNLKNHEFHSGFVIRNSSGNFQYFDQENLVNVWMNAGFKKWGVRTSITLGSFGDLRQGSIKPIDSWSSNIYVSNINSQDISNSNPNPLVQKRSGYQQLDIQQRWLYDTEKGFRHQLNFQYSMSSNVNRYDRLSELQDTQKPVYAEWYYGPEMRALAAYQLDFFNATKWFDTGKIIASFQMNKESRITRKFENPNQTSRSEEVLSYNLNGDWAKNFGLFKFFYGFEGYYNTVKSEAFTENILTGELSSASTRYPAGGSSVSNAAVYTSFQRDFLKKITLTAGLRYTYNELKSDFENQSFYPFPFQTATQKNAILCGQIGLIYRPINRLDIKVNLSQGFRAANVDDMSKVFDSNPGILVIPNIQLKAERTETFDVSISWNKNGRFSFNAGVFYTLLHDAIVSGKSTLNGADSVIYDGVISAVRTNVNAQQAYIQGANIGITWKVISNYSFNATMHYTEGKFRTDSSDQRLDHIPPLYGKIAIDRMLNRKWSGSFWMMFNVEKPLSMYNVNGEDNLQYATPNGTPAWQTFNVQISWNPKKTMQLSAACENIVDTQYRVFSSGISAPGRLLRITLKANF